MAQEFSSCVVDYKWYHDIVTHGRLTLVAIFLKQARACRVMCHVRLCGCCVKPQKVQNRLHGGAEKCQLGILMVVQGKGATMILAFQC